MKQDIAVINIEDGIFEVVGTASSEVGGEEMEYRLVEHFLSEVKSKHYKIPTDLAPLRATCTQIKTRLSTCVCPCLVNSA